MALSPETKKLREERKELSRRLADPTPQERQEDEDGAREVDELLPRPTKASPHALTPEQKAENRIRNAEVKRREEGKSGPGLDPAELPEKLRTV